MYAQVVIGLVQCGRSAPGSRPPQHAWPTPPQLPHEPFAQTPPAHLSPAAKQTLTFPEIEQQPPSLQLEPAQHGWPGPPHSVMHVPSAEHAAAPAQTPPLQQGWPGFPHAEQPAAAPMQTPSRPGQAAPLSRQVPRPLPTQQPSPHARPAQQGCPGPPHWVQMLVGGWHSLFGPRQGVASNAQHGSPTPPHGAQVWLLSLQVEPAPQVMVLAELQQAWSRCPQPVHLPPEQVPPKARSMVMQASPSAMQVPPLQQPLAQTSPAQQTSPSPPQCLHEPIVQVRPEVQVPGAGLKAGQQTWPSAPQDAHVPALEQVVPGAGAHLPVTAARLPRATARGAHRSRARASRAPGVEGPALLSGSHAQPDHAAGSGATGTGGAADLSGRPAGDGPGAGVGCDRARGRITATSPATDGSIGCGEIERAARRRGAVPTARRGEHDQWNEWKTARDAHRWVDTPIRTRCATGTAQGIRRSPKSCRAGDARKEPGN